MDIKNTIFKAGTVVHSTWEAEAGGSPWLQGQPGLHKQVHGEPEQHSETLPPKKFSLDSLNNKINIKTLLEIRIQFNVLSQRLERILKYENKLKT